MDSLVIFAATGVAAGLLAGLFGVGGGLIMVPALAFLLPARGVPEGVYMQLAIGTSLAVIALTSLSSAAAHQRRGSILWAHLLRLVPGLAAGAVLGAIVADALTGTALQRIVGVGALLVAVQMLAGRSPVTAAGSIRPGTVELVGAGTVIGALSSLIGIGGGSLSVPYLAARGAGMREAVGTSAACGVPIAWAGALSFVVTGWAEPGLPARTLGYVSLDGLAGLAIASVLAAPFGVRLAHRLPPLVLRRAFGVLLLVVGVQMLRAPAV